MVLKYAPVLLVTLGLGFGCSERPGHDQLPYGANGTSDDADGNAKKEKKMADPSSDKEQPSDKTDQDVPAEKDEETKEPIESPKPMEPAAFPVAVPLPITGVPAPVTPPTNSATAIGKELIVYKLAVAGNTDFQKGKSVDQSIAEIKKFVADMNIIYRRDVAIEFQLAGDDVEKKLLFTPANDPIDRSLKPSYNAFPAINSFISNVVGAANYDIGHTLYYNPSDGSGWGSDSPCRQNSKANGTSFSYGAMIHEVGHQFGAPHSCYIEGNDSMRNTIMCRGGENSDYFHQASLEKIINYSRKGDGKLCGTRKAVANTPPRPYLGFKNDITIPAQTPFALTGAAIDTENQNELTYNWQQIDPNVPLDTGKYDNANAAFRSFFPTAGGFVRYLPNLPDLVQGKATPTEILSKQSRTLNFALVVRDNSKLAGGVDWINAKVNVLGTAGPFKITAPAAAVSWKVGSSQTISWDVAGTDKAPISTSKVNILLSTDNGATFHMIKTAVPNTGAIELMVPDLVTTSGKIMIQAVDNIFFAVGSAAKISIVK